MLAMMTYTTFCYKQTILNYTRQASQFKWIYITIYINFNKVLYCYCRWRTLYHTYITYSSSAFPDIPSSTSSSTIASSSSSSWSAWCSLCPFHNDSRTCYLTSIFIANCILNNNKTICQHTIYCTSKYFVSLLPFI